MTWQLMTAKDSKKKQTCWEKGKSHERCIGSPDYRPGTRGAVAYRAVRGREEEMTDIGWVLTIVVLVASFCIFETWMDGKR